MLLQETAKKVPDQLLVWGIGALNGSKLILDDQGNNLLIWDQFGILQILQRSPTAHTSAVIGQELFFAVSCSKPALGEFYSFSVSLFDS